MALSVTNAAQPKGATGVLVLADGSVVWGKGFGAAGLKDMGRVMAELKARHGTELDMSKASGLVKAALV